MKTYSIQEKRFIETEPFASSEFKPQDTRTCQLYNIDINGLIHSNSLNYSLLFTKALTVDEFNKKVKEELRDYYKITIF